MQRRWARRYRAFAHPTELPRQLGHALQKRFFGGVYGIGRADMHPDAVEAEPEQALLLIGGIEHPRQRELALGRAVENRRRHDRSARIDERNHLVLPAL